MVLTPGRCPRRSLAAFRRRSLVVHQFLSDAADLVGLATGPLGQRLRVQKQLSILALVKIGEHNKAAFLGNSV
jgi:hypothetical protein